MLMSVGLDLPKTIFAHGWWLKDNKKMSKSIGNIVNPYLIKNNYSSEYCRYYLIKELSLGNDCNFSIQSLINRVNSELVNKIGNLIYRSSILVFKKCNIRVFTISRQHSV